MRLITYTAKNAPHIKPEKKNAAKAFMIFRNSGAIQLNSALTKLLNIQEGARIALHQDAQYPSDWYVSLSDKPDGFKVTMLKTKGCTIMSNQLVGLVLASTSAGKDAAAPPSRSRLKLNVIRKKKGYMLCVPQL